MSHQLQHLMSTILRNRRDQYSTRVLDAAWWFRHATTETGVVLDERPGLGTPRDPQPLRCLQLNGTNQYGVYSLREPISQYPFTLFGWANQNEGVRSFLSISSASTTNQYLAFNPVRTNTTGQLIRSNTTEVLTTISGSNLVGTMNSWVVVFTDSTSAVIYKNGQLVQTLSGLTAVSLSSVFDRFIFGSVRAASPTLYYSGKAMHCGYLRRAATLQDAQTFHTTGIIPNAEGLFLLDGNSTTIAYNIGTEGEPFARRNLLTWTEEFDIANSIWNKPSGGINTSIGTLGIEPNVSVSPEIRDTADRVHFINQSDSDIGLRYTINAVGGQTYTASMWVKGESSDIGKQVRLRLRRNTTGGGAFITQSFALTAEWVRISVSLTLASDNVDIQLVLSSNVGEATSALIWGAQLELGSTPTDYQRITTGSYTNEMSLINGSAGMLYTGRDVPFSRQNEVGYSPRRNLLERTEQLNISPWTGAVRDTAQLQSDGGWKLVNFDGATGVRLAQERVGSPLTTYTAQIEVRGEGSDVGKPINLMLIRSGVTTSTFTDINVNLQSTYQVVSVTWTGLADTQGWQIRLNHVTGGAAAPIVRFPQVELGSTATDYQRIGTSPGTSVLFPATLPSPEKSAAGDDLQFAGPVPMNGQAEESNAFSFDGVDDIIGVDLDGVAGDELVTLNFIGAGSTFPTKNSDNWLRINENTTILTANSFSKTASATGVVYDNLIIGRLYKLTLQCSLTVADLCQIRSGTGGATIADFGTASNFDRTITFTAADTSIYFRFATSATTVTFSNISVKELPVITNQGTSVLSYHPQGLGITGTAGTAYDIRLGAAEEIPCSEGEDDKVYGVIRNVAYPIINGQVSNWDTKQNQFHYNMVHGHSQEPFDPVAEINALLFGAGQQGLFIAPTWTPSLITGSSFGTGVQTLTDLSPRNNPASQATPASRAAWFREPWTGRRNLLLSTNDITGTGWASTRQTVSGAEDNQKIVPSVDNDTHLTSRDHSFTTGQAFTFSFEAKAAEYRAVSMRLGAGSLTFNLIDGVVNSGNTYNASFWTLGTVSITSVGDGWFRCVATVTRTGVTSTQPVGFTAIASKDFTLSGTNAEQPSFAGDGVSGIFVRRPQLQTGSTATAYQRVTTAFDVTEAGQRDCYGVRTDGIDDGYQTAGNVDFSGTDKVTVFAAVRRLSDAAAGLLVELSSNFNTVNSRAFALQAPTGANTTIEFAHRITDYSTGSFSSSASPHTSILTMSADISLPTNEIAFIRQNGVSQTLTRTLNNPNTGNYGTHPLFIFRRGGTTLPFNGNLYALIVAGGSYSLSTIQRVERLLSRITPTVNL